MRANQKLVLGDCCAQMTKIKAGSIDLVIADPPYGLNYKSTHVPKHKQRRLMKNDGRPFIWFLWEAARCLKDGGCCLVFCRYDSWHQFSNAMVLAGLKVVGQVAWDKGNHGMGDLRGAPGLQHELIIFAVKGRFTFPGKRLKSIISVPRVSNLNHPAEKPVGLQKVLIEHCSRPGETVLDPFAGTASVGVACRELERNYIGIELDPDYYSIGKNRLTETTSA